MYNAQVMLINIEIYSHVERTYEYIIICQFFQNVYNNEKAKSEFAILRTRWDSRKVKF